jgi:hypothetical protein
VGEFLPIFDKLIKAEKTKAIFAGEIWKALPDIERDSQQKLDLLSGGEKAEFKTHIEKGFQRIKDFQDQHGTPQGYYPEFDEDVRCIFPVVDESWAYNELLSKISVKAANKMGFDTVL